MLLESGILMKFFNIFLDTSEFMTKAKIRDFFDNKIEESLRKYAFSNRVDSIEDRLELLRKDVSRVRRILLILIGL